MAESATRVLAHLALRAIHNLATVAGRFEGELGDLATLARVTLALGTLGLEQMASSEMPGRVERAMRC